MSTNKTGALQAIAVAFKQLMLIVSLVLLLLNMKTLRWNSSSTGQ
jgi:hypothetical protein